MRLTTGELLKLYGEAWELADKMIATLTPIQTQQDISSILGRVEAIKSMIEDQSSTLHSFDPN